MTIVDLFGDLKTGFIKLKMRNAFACLSFTGYSSSGWSDMRMSIRSPGIASGSVRVGSFLSNTTSPAKVTTLVQCACWHVVVEKKKTRHCYVDEIVNLRLELVEN